MYATGALFCVLRQKKAARKKTAYFNGFACDCKDKIIFFGAPEMHQAGQRSGIWCGTVEGVKMSAHSVTFDSSTMTDMLTRFQSVKDRISQATLDGVRNAQPTLLAVSKKQPLSKIKALVDVGQRAFGESYVQEAVEKISQLSTPDLCWHFIGPVQSNKTRQLAAHFHWVQSVDRMKILTRLNEQRPADALPLNVLLQLKIGDEDSKSGAQAVELLDMARAAREMDRLVIRGVMCIPPPADDVAIQRSYFAQARTVYLQLLSICPTADTLSMGMSGDLEAAIREGSTMVRIGTDLFGPRL